MKKRRYRIMAVVLVLLLVVGVVSPAAAAEDTAGFAVGDLVEFGSYPQSQVTDETLIAALNAAPQAWQSYGYYSGTGDSDDGQMTASDYMQFCDVDYGGQKYRGVLFTQYRPWKTGFTASAQDSAQDDMGYFTNVIYWFLWEPLIWRVLSPETGLVLSQTLIDSQPSNNFSLRAGVDSRGQPAFWGNAAQTYYLNDYACSSLRAWLTDETDEKSFLNTAFSAAQRAQIEATTLDNSAGNAVYSCAATTDKVYLLSRADTINAAYGFRADGGSDPVRQAKGTDYARCQGLCRSAGSDCTDWGLRTASYDSQGIFQIQGDGAVQYYHVVTYVGFGVRPAMRVDLCAAAPHTHTYHASAVTAPTCTANGYTTYVCDRCFGSRTDDFTDALGHAYPAQGDVTAPTCTEDGYTTYTCTRCTHSYVDDHTAAFGHDYPAEGTVTPPTCSAGGYTTYTCSRCRNSSYRAGYTDPLGHAFGAWTIAQAPTADDPGTETRSCTRCSAIETRTMAALTPGCGFFSGGYGTADAPFLISNASDFDHIDDFYAAYGDALPANPVYFLQTADIRFFYYDAYDNDGTTEYFPYDPWETGDTVPYYTARTTPAKVMQNAVYDGGGHGISLDGNYAYTIMDSGYVGLFGLVTDSTIRDLTINLGYGNAVRGIGETDHVGGAVGRAENCWLDNMHVVVFEYMERYPAGLLAGSAAGCRVTNCFTNASFGEASLIGGDSGYTFFNAWAMGAWTSDTAALQNVTGVIIADGMAFAGRSAQQCLSSGCPGFVLVDTQGVAHTAPVQYDPCTAGLLFYVCPAETVTVTAGAHGTVDGAGEYFLYTQIFTGTGETPQTITGLRPIPDTGYVFAGWDIAEEDDWGADDRSVTLQPDSSYVYSSASMFGTVILTANFAPHEMHTFGDWAVTTAAACTTNGVRTRTCSVCGSAETENIPARGHDFGEWAVTTPATSTAAGTETRGCQRCDATETRSIPVLPTLSGVLSMHAPDTPVHTGDTVTVTVDLEQNPGLAGLSLALAYDPDVLTLTGVLAGGMLQSGNAVGGNDLTVLPYTILWEDALARERHTETGMILTITFRVKETAAAGQTTVTLTCDTASTFDMDLHAVAMTTSGCSLAVLLHTPGDADGDGQVTLLDVANMLRSLAGGWGVEIDDRNSDVDGDGVFNLRDIVLLRRYLAGGWGISLQ